MTEPSDPSNISENNPSADELQFDSQLDVSGVQELVTAVRNEIGRVIVGQHKMVDLLAAALLANGHVLIEGVPGVAKTLTARLLAKTLDARYSRIQFTPDLMPSDIIGTSVFNPKTTGFEFKKGPVFANIVLIDEINRSPAKTQAALFEVMEERQITADGETYPFESPFMVIATQNPIEYEGTYRLPEAQLDRFLFKIEVPYPSLDEEVEIMSGSFERKGKHGTEAIQTVVKTASITNEQQTVQQIRVKPELMNYIAQIVHKTRNSPLLTLGASPRASVFLMKAAQAWAALQGRDFVIPDDVKEMAAPVLAHRVTLTPEKEMEGLKPAKAILHIVDQVEVPR
ncbi:MAG: AAA family ATPase [Balneolaceae bacterium]